MKTDLEVSAAADEVKDERPTIDLSELIRKLISLKEKRELL